MNKSHKADTGPHLGECCFFLRFQEIIIKNSFLCGIFLISFFFIICYVFCVLLFFFSLLATTQPLCLKIQFDKSRDWQAKTMAVQGAVTDQNLDKSIEDKMPQWIRSKWFQRTGMPLEWSDDMTQ